MDIIGTKVLVAVLFAVIRFMFGILPIHICSWLKIDKIEQGKRTVNEARRKLLDCCVALVQSFGGGVLFATCFLHMMPEVYHSIEELKNGNLGVNKYPYSQLLVSFGFFLVYFIEEISHWLMSRFSTDSIGSKKNIATRTSSTSTIISKENKIAPAAIKNDVEVSPNVEGVLEFKKGDNSVDFDPDDVSMKVAVDEKVQTENSRRTLENTLTNEQEINAELDEIIEDQVRTQQQMLRCILIVLALSFHAIFEGIAIGLQNAISDIWYLFVAVTIHSGTILFCIGLEIVLAGTKSSTLIIHMFFLALTSPVGVVLGLIISLTTDNDASAKSFAVVFLEGISAGTILYITFFEVLSREKELRIYRFRRALCIWAGFGMMASLECLKVD